VEVEPKLIKLGELINNHIQINKTLSSGLIQVHGVKLKLSPKLKRELLSKRDEIQAEIQAILNSLLKG